MSQQVQKGQFEKFDASSYKIAIVTARFNREICDGLLESALKTCEQYGIKNPSVYKVPGSVEIPVILKILASTKKYDCLVALGAVIRGETPHFEYVAKMTSEGVLRVMMDYEIPIGFGVLTCENQDQAIARVHVGGEAVEAGLQSAKIIKILSAGGY